MPWEFKYGKWLAKNLQSQRLVADIAGASRSASRSPVRSTPPKGSNKNAATTPRSTRPAFK